MQIIGEISDTAIKLLRLSDIYDRNIYIGETNIEHMRCSHPTDYSRYKDRIADILSAPDYIGKNPRDDSIEYVKEFVTNGEYVKVAVRVTASHRFYARSLYVLNKRRTQNFIEKGTLLKYNT